MSWPTDSTFDYLLLGLLPLIYLLWRVVVYGVREVLQLRFVSTVSIWVGYHFSPWVGYLTDSVWDKYLLVPGLIDEGLLFASLCMIALLVGYHLIIEPNQQGNYLLSERVQLPNVSKHLLFGLAFVCIVTFFIGVGGVDEAWSSSKWRGEGQFAARGFYEKLAHISRIFTTVSQIMLGVAASIYLLQHQKIEQQLIGISCLFVASLQLIHGFSRGAGMIFILFAFIALRLRGGKVILPAVIALLLAAFLGGVGLQQRGQYHPGIGNFAEAAISHTEETASGGEIFFTHNPADAMAPWTRKIFSKHLDMTDDVELGLNLIWNLNPFPSEFFPLKPVGESLSKIMGTWGHTGLTTPTLAELYYVFGYFGCVVYLVIGAVYAWFENNLVKRNDLMGVIGIILCFASLTIGLHSSLRAMTRQLLYAYCFVLIGRWYQNARMRGKQAISQDIIP